MKTSLKVIALLTAAAAPSVALAQTIDGAIPLVANVEFLVITFTVAFLGLMVVTDYTRRPRTLISSTVGTGTARRDSRENHRLAA